MIYTPQNAHATTPDKSVGCDGDASGELYLLGADCSPAHRATSAEADVSAHVHANMVHEVNQLRETLAKTKSAFEAVQTRLQVLEQQQPRMKWQLGILIVMMQHAAQPPFSVRAPPRSRGTDADVA